MLHFDTFLIAHGVLFVLLRRFVEETTVCMDVGYDSIAH